jgi:hypothetical protein
MEKLNKYSAPEIKIDEVGNDDDGLGGINLDLYMTPKVGWYEGWSRTQA